MDQAKEGLTMTMSEYCRWSEIEKPSRLRMYGLESKNGGEGCGIK